MACVINCGCRKNCTNCIDDYSNTGIPECINSQIDSFKAIPVKNPPVEIYQYTYNGNTCYYITSYCCDIPSLLIDENCNIICHPDGGLTGNGDGKCTDFFANRTGEVLIWKDTR